MYFKYLWWEHKKGHSLLAKITGKRTLESSYCLRENNEIIRKALSSL
jgi:hypothetical protein